MKFAIDVVTITLLLCAPAVRGSSDDGGGGPTVTRTDASRLPDDTMPESYDLWFDMAGSDPRAFTAVARVTTSVQADTQTITLNARDLRVTNVTVTDVSRATLTARSESAAVAVAVLGWTVSAREERLVVLLNASVTAGTRLQVTVRYAAEVRTDGTGVHSVAAAATTMASGPLGDDGGRPGWSIMTQFKSTYARRAFPCYDEPSYKATFQTKVVRRKDQIALSNMPIRKIESRKNTDVIYFKTTPLMSTYSLAFYVGEFVPNRGNDSRITVYTRKDHANQTKYIITEASKHLDSLSKYTGIEYTLPKMDLLAVPDLSFEAMENWGLNIYREDLILLHEESKTEAKIRASEIVQYEFAHQWFGNLVTSLWWNYAWLNDGFALYFKFFATKMVNENWPMEEWFLVEIHQSALAYDQSSRNSITSLVRTPEEIEDVFNEMTHKKAASVLRMLRCLVTEDLFQKSLKKYLSDFKENVVEPKNLYERFDSVLNDNQYKLKDGMTIHEFMSNWTLQAGYPVLNITKNETLNTFLITQSRFVIKSNEIDNNTSAAWHIGLTYTTKSEKNFNDLRPFIWTNESSKLTKVPVLNSGWYIFNIQSSGFYRVNYEISNWNALIKQLYEVHDDIHVLNRAQLIDDSFNLARVGYLDYSVPLGLSKYLEKENDATPWYSAINSFSYLIKQMYRSKEGFKNMKTYFSKLVEPIYGKLDYLVSNGNNNFNVTKAWGTLSTWACRLENTFCVQKSLVYFKKWKSGQKIPADIKDVVFCVGLKNSIGSTTFNMMFNLYKKTNSYSEKTPIESALGCSSNRTQLNEYINHIMDGTINEKDYRSVITAISATPLGLNVLYDFLSTNLNKILDEVSNGEEIVKFIYETLATKITNDDEIEKIKNMKNNLTTPVSLRSSFEKSFKKTIDNLLWFNTYADVIIRWTMKNNEADPTTKTASTSVESSISSVSEQPTPNTSDTTGTTDESFTSTGSEELPSSTFETTRTTDENYSSTGSEELSSSTSETTWTTNEPTATPVVSESSHLHYNFKIILIFATIVVLANA